MGVVDADRVSRRLGIDSVDRENVVRRWSAARAISKRSKERERVPLPRTRLERILEPERVSTVDRGHKISDHLRSTLNSFDKKGWRRSIHQRKMHKMMHAALAVQIYEDAVYTHQKEILDYNGWDSLKQEIMVTAPRRFGKSWGVGMFVSSAAVCVPHADIGVFSTGSRVSGNNDGMSAIVKMMLTQVLGIEKFTRDSGEYLFFEVSHGDVRKIKTFPGSVHSYVFRFRVFAENERDIVVMRRPVGGHRLLRTDSDLVATGSPPRGLKNFRLTELNPSMTLLALTAFWVILLPSMNHEGHFVPTTNSPTSYPTNSPTTPPTKSPTVTE